MRCTSSMFSLQTMLLIIKNTNFIHTKSSIKLKLYQFSAKFLYNIQINTVIIDTMMSALFKLLIFFWIRFFTLFIIFIFPVIRLIQETLLTVVPLFADVLVRAKLLIVYILMLGTFTIYLNLKTVINNITSLYNITILLISYLILVYVLVIRISELRQPLYPSIFLL